MMTPRTSFGWPLERVRGRPISNLIRLLLWTDIGETWRGRKAGAHEHYRQPLSGTAPVTDTPDTNVGCGTERED